MKKAGVDFRVCGQAVLGMKIDHKTILPEIQVDLWAGIHHPQHDDAGLSAPGRLIRVDTKDGARGFGSRALFRGGSLCYSNRARACLCMRV